MGLRLVAWENREESSDQRSLWGRKACVKEEVRRKIWKNWKFSKSEILEFNISELKYFFPFGSSPESDQGSGWLKWSKWVSVPPLFPGTLVTSPFAIFTGQFLPSLQVSATVLSWRSLCWGKVSKTWKQGKKMSIFSMSYQNIIWELLSWLSG